MRSWKPNWDETQQNFIEWWNHEGFVLTVGTHLRETPHEIVAEPPTPGLSQSA